MSASSSKKSKLAALIAILIVSPVTMIVMFWFFPLATAVVTLGVFVLLGVSARLARASDVVDISEIEHW